MNAHVEEVLIAVNQFDFTPQGCEEAKKYLQEHDVNYDPKITGWNIVLKANKHLNDKS